MEFGKVVMVAESAIHTAKVEDLMTGDVILVPAKGKRGVLRHSNGSVSLVFPRSGAIEQDGRTAGSLSDLGGHDPAVVGRVDGGWAADGVAVKAKPKASGRAPHTVKGSPEAKAHMAKIRAARKGGSAPAAKTAEPATDNHTHFRAALASLADAIDHLNQVNL